MQKHKICSFFGHRKIDITEELKQKVKELIEANFVPLLLKFLKSNAETKEENNEDNVE